jgi:hypothetical protein
MYGQQNLKKKCFGHFLCPSSAVFHCTHSNGVCHTACEQEQNGTGSVLFLLAGCQQTCMTYTIAVCTVKTPDDGQRNCPNHVSFYSQNNFEKLMHLVSFVIRIYHDARSPERQKV